MSDQMEKYRGRVIEFIDSFGDRLSATARDDILKMVDYGEPAEALVLLAWGLSQQKTSITSSEYHRLLELGGDLLDPGHLPPDLVGLIGDH